MSGKVVDPDYPGQDRLTDQEIKNLAIQEAGTVVENAAKNYPFPTETIELPSMGLLYPESNPLSSGKVDVKYMTAKEEDILTSQNLIKNGVVIDKLLDSLILSEGVKSDDLVLGDKNAVMVASRVLAYGPEYSTEVTHPTTDEVMTHKFNLADCPFKKLPADVDYSSNAFDFELPVSKVKLKWKLLTGLDDETIQSELNAKKK